MMESLMIEMKAYLIDLERSSNFLIRIVRVVLIILAVRIGVSLISRFIDSAIRRKKQVKSGVSPERFETLGKTGKKLVKYTLYFLGAMVILDEFNVDTKAILGAAGIGGVAIGFGAQSLVKDIISGFFILQDDSFAIGDHVKIQGYEGRIEEVGLRVTKIRDFSGDLHIIPNGKINIISNLSRGSIRALVMASIAYEEDIEHAIRTIEEICRGMEEEFDFIVSGPDVLGVEKLGGSGVDIRVSAMVEPMKHWELERILKKRIKEGLEKEGIEIPYNRLVVLDGGKN